MSEGPDATVETCPRGHERTTENTFRRALSGYLECRPCRAEDRAKHVAAHPPQSRRPRAPKAPIDPATVEQLRAAAGLSS